GGRGGDAGAARGGAAPRHHRDRGAEGEEPAARPAGVEGDSISNIAHQLGYFETIASWRLVPALRERIDGVTVEQVGEAAAACFRTANRTIGWFDPQPPADEPPAPIGAGAGAGPAARERR